MKKLFCWWGRTGGTDFSQSLPQSLRSSRHFKKLSKAVSAGDLEKVTEYVRIKKYNVNMQDREFRTPLHLACANGQSNTVSQLIDKICKMNAWEREKLFPMTKAVQCKKEICATFLLHCGANPNLVDSNGNTALHYAVCGEKISLVEKLLEYGANLEVQNKDGHTPLLLAVTENNATMVKFLLKKGANVNASDKNQRTALMIAVINEPTTLVRPLLKQNVDLSCQDIYGFTAEEYASFNGFSIYHQLIADYGMKNAKQIPNSKNAAFDNEPPVEEQIKRCPGTDGRGSSWRGSARSATVAGRLSRRRRPASLRSGPEPRADTCLRGTEDVMELLEEDLTCPICCSLFNDPRVLPCSHNFCKKCLEGIFEGNVRNSLWKMTPVKCPTCRKETSATGVNSLQVNYSLKGIVEKYNKIKISPKMPVCKEHLGQPLNIFCLTDKQLICGVCATRGEHAKHVFCSIEEAYAREKDAFESLFQTNK